MAKRIVWTAQAKADVRAIEQPIALQCLPQKLTRDVAPQVAFLTARGQREIRSVPTPAYTFGSS